MKYKKPFLTVEEQISLLENRGLIIENKEIAISFLENISYYHLAIYAKTFQHGNNQFNEGTSFNDILKLYNFDKKLRLLLLDILERIEMSFKRALAYEITKVIGSNYWYVNENNFSKTEKIKELLQKTKNSKEIYIKHFYKKYTNSQYPPVWIFFESLTFGECSYLANNLCEKNKMIIANFYKTNKAVTKRFYYLSHLRNACAHHSRVWNRKFTISISKDKKYLDIFEGSSYNSLFSYLVIIQIFLSNITSNFVWLNKLNDLISEYNISISKMGFPEDWFDRLNSV